MQNRTASRNLTLYQKGHLLLSGIRIFEFNNEYAPGIEDLWHMFESISREDLEFVVRRMENMGVVNVVGAAGSHRIFIGDHLKLEELKEEDKGPSMENEVAKFKEQQSKIGEKVTQMQAEQKNRKKDLYADMEQKLKAEIAKREKK